MKASKPTPGEMGKWVEGKFVLFSIEYFVVICSILGHHTVYRMSASSEDDRKDWIRALRIGSQNQMPKQRLS